MARELIRTLVAYAIALGVMTFYGGRVCPLIDSLGLGRLAGILALCFGIGALLKLAALAWLKPHQRRSSPWGFFAADLGVWVSVAVIFATFDWLVWQFPFWTSGMKMVVGTLAIGFYASSFDALVRERELVELAASGGAGGPVTGRGLKTAQRFFGFTAASLSLMSAVLLLLLYKDLVMEQIPVEAQVSAVSGHAHASPHWSQAIFMEIFFVLLVLLAGTIAVTLQYAGNLRRMFELEQQALDAVKSGRFDVSVPVVSKDEFGKIADGTNGMIAGLRDKEKFRSILGKVVSPTVAKRILDQGGMLGGDTVEATILFTDLRDYTTLSEKVTPQQLVTILNEYFDMVNRIVERNGGFVNKFIGDAVMAVFGLDDVKGSCDAALRTALEVRTGLTALNQSLRDRGMPTIENGIGIHHGTMVAGVMGAQERVEFTVIGDTVNVASRLESLTKSLTSFVAISKAVYQNLQGDARAKLEPVGEHQLKGKSEKLLVYSLLESTRRSSG